jgi:hypothetical protein
MGPIGSFRKTAGIQKRKKERKGDIILRFVLILLIIIPAWNLGSVLQKVPPLSRPFAQKDSQMKTKDVKFVAAPRISCTFFFYI